MNTKIIIGVLAVGGIFLLVTIFGNSGDKALVEQSNPIETTEGQEAILATLPPDMPTNVPMYPGAILQSSQKNDTESERNITLSLVTDDAVADVNTWYRGALIENGWAKTDDRNVSGYVLLKGENGDLTTFVQAANNSDTGKVTITQRIRIR